jgi:Fe-S cluster assembly protein SufD
VQPLRIRVADESVLEAPIYVAYVWSKDAHALMMHPRLSVIVGRNAKAAILEHHVGVNIEPNFTNAVMNIDVGDAAELDHLRIQSDAAHNFSISTVRANLSRAASYRQYAYVFGGGQARSNIDVHLLGEQSRTELHGLIFAHQSQHLDVRTCIQHRVPDTCSREDYRGIADDRGRVVFNGKVIVAKDAQRTDAAQSSRNLLLSPHAEIDTRPELEIDANDVKCAHGATVGQLDANALFYLQSRGISANEGRALLTQAFAAEVIDRIPLAPVREYVTSHLLSRLRSQGEIA